MAQSPSLSSASENPEACHTDPTFVKESIPKTNCSISSPHSPQYPGQYSSSEGRLTIPVEQGIDDQIESLLRRIKADAVRNSDGTELPEIVKTLATKVYATYFPARGDQSWALGKPHTRVHQFIMSTPAVALPCGVGNNDTSATHSVAELSSTTNLSIDPISGYYSIQLQPELNCDISKYWQVIDRTTGKPLSANQWQLQVINVDNQESLPSDSKEQNALSFSDISEEIKQAEPAPDIRVVIPNAEIGHVYTVGFLARQIWDSTQMYNYLTNNWQDDPNRYREFPYDVRLPEVWEHTHATLAEWIGEHPEVDVVRFTTFFYHFTIAYNNQATEKFVDWFGYSCSVSVEALEEFASEYGYEITPEDFIDAGYYNNAFRPPHQHYRDWLDFTHKFVCKKAGELVTQVHKSQKEAMMFLGDNWIGTEPYGPYFHTINLDAVVGSVGSAATCRMISDIPHVRYTEGRFIPYFFPDVFRPGGDPTGEANESWIAARRAICRSPLDRMGYGGYISLALKFPKFIDRVEEIANEFRQICDMHKLAAGSELQNNLISENNSADACQDAANLPIRIKSGAACAPFKVAILNSWGKLRSWQTHMVSHAQWYRQTYSYIGVLESLAGLPFEVDFVSFDDLLENKLDPRVKVIINAGGAGTSYSGGEIWRNPNLQAWIRRWVSKGGGFIGVGHPTAVMSARTDPNSAESGNTFALSDVLGVDMERGFGLSSRYPACYNANHFITQPLSVSKNQDYFQDIDDCNSSDTKAISVTRNSQNPQEQSTSDETERSLPDPSQPMGADPEALAALPTFEVGEDCGYICAVDPSVQILARRSQQMGRVGLAQSHTFSVDLAAHTYGEGRSVYFSGLPYTPMNSRILHRALYWAAGFEDIWADASNPDLVSNNENLEITNFATIKKVLVCNIDRHSEQSGIISTPLGKKEVLVPAGGAVWI